MSTVVFVYESHVDQSAALVLQQLLQAGAGDVTLCLETPPGNVLSDVSGCGVQIARNIGRIKNALDQQNDSKQLECFHEIIQMGWMRLPSEQACAEVNVTEALTTFLNEGQGVSDCIKATLQLIRIAKENQVKVLGIDLPFEKRSGDDVNDMVPRNEYMYNQLLELSQRQDSVTIYLVGLGHAGLANSLRAVEGVIVLEYFVHDFLPNTFSEEFPGIGEGVVEISVGIAGGALNQEQIIAFASTMRDDITRCREVGEKPVAFSPDAEAQAGAADGESKEDSLLGDTAHALPNEHGAMPRAMLVEAGAPGGDSTGSAIIAASLDAAQGAAALLGLGSNCTPGGSGD
jgi:hypothetical protein